MRQDILKSLPKGAKLLNSDDTLKSLPKDIKIDSVYSTESVNPYFEDIRKEQSVDQVRSIIDTMPDLDDSKKKIASDLILNGVRGEELNNSVLALRGKHPKQDGGDKYYYNDKGIPIPLANDERPPKGFDVANDLHGTQEEANKKGFFASAGAHLYNGVLKGVLGLEGLANLPYALSTGEEADWYKAAKNRVESSLFKTPEYETENQLFDSKDMKGVEDFFDPKRYDLHANTLQGAALNGLESVTSFLVGTKGLGAAGKLLGAAAEGAGLLKAGTGIVEGEVVGGSRLTDLIEGTSKTGALTHAAGGSYAITLPEVLDYMDENGITGREKYLLGSAIAVPVALTELIGGVEGQFAKNMAAKEAKSAMIKGLVDGAKRQIDETGSLSKEFLGEMFKATTSESLKLQKSFAGDLARNIGEEAGTEALQDLEKKGLAEIYDHLTKEDKFKEDPFSLQSFGEYYNSALNGAAGAGGMSTVATIQKRKQEIQEKQSQNIFTTVQKGQEAVDVLKKNINKAVQDGEITAEQGAESVIKVDAYDSYNKQLTDASTSLKDEEKRRVFDLTFEKANLESQIPTDYEAEKLNGVQQALINNKKKQAKHLQDEIDKLILRDDVQNTTTPTAKKTEQEVAKDIEAEKELELIRKTKIKSKEQVDETKPEVYKTPQFVLDEKRTYEEVPNEEFNSPKFNTRKKKYLIVDHVNKLPNQTTSGVVKIDNKHKKDNETFNVTFPDNKTARFASSQKTDVEKTAEGNITGGHRGNTYQENFDNAKNPVGQELGVTVKTLKDSGRKVAFIWNGNKTSPKYGKHIGMIKESLKGNSNYSKADLEEMADLRMTNMGPTETGPKEVITEPVKPISPADVKGTKPKVVLGTNAREQFITDNIEELKKTPGAYDEGTNYEKIFGPIYDERQAGGRKFLINKANKNEQPETEGITVTGQESATGSNETVNGKSTEVSKEVKVKKQGTKRINQKIKDRDRLKALSHDVYDPYHVVLQYFAGNGAISTDAIKKLYRKSKEEVFARNAYTLSAEKWGEDLAPSLDSLAHSLWQSNTDVTPNADTSTYKKALEEAIGSYNTRTDMAKALNDILGEEEQKAPIEEIVDDTYAEAEKQGLTDEFNKVTDGLEKLDNDELTNLVIKPGEFDKWEDDSDIITGNEEGDVFQKSQELQYAEGQYAKAETELKAAKKALDLKRKELDAGLIADQEDLFGERQSTNETSLFDERASQEGRNTAIEPFKQRYEAAVTNYSKWKDKVKELGDSEETQMELFQKVSERKANVEKIVAKLKASMPNIKVVFDENLKAAGKWSPANKTITINPYHAGLDTPIHEYGHILIDAIGYNNKVIQAAIKQLKTTPLWAETKERYKELDEENLGKEVLAEAIGREGADIFDEESDKSKFKVFLDYIFDWLKTKLGINKNIAKSLAKQVISGRGVVATEGKEQLQKAKETDSEKKQRKAEKKAKRAKEQEEVDKILKGREIKELSFEEMVNVYNHVIGYEKSIQDKYFGDVKIQIAYRLFTEKKNQLEKWQKEGKVKGYNVEESNKTDIKDKDVLMKNLSHMTQIVPELQAFSKMFEGAYFDMTQERYELKNELQKFGQAVIKEKNKKLGILGKARELFSSDNAKYFEFVENPKAYLGEDIEGDPIYGAGYYTLEEGKKEGFTEAQMNFLKFMHKLQSERNAQLEAMGRDMTNEVLKVDKGVAEAWKTEGLMSAFSSFLGNGFNLRNVRITYNGKNMTYGEVEKDLLAKGNKGTIEKLVALKDMFKYNMAAKRQIQKGIHVDEGDDHILQLKGGAKYGIDPHGALINKFMKNRSAERGYSKDFYKAAFDFIDESTHSKHMQELLPYIDSIEYLNKMGLVDDEGNVLHGVKNNVTDWVKEWKDLHLFKVDKVGKLGPEADAVMKLLRTLTSQIVMAFNIKAGLINIAMGQYNNLRKETAKELKEGHKRMIANPKKMADILKKYQVISIDYDSNPKKFAGRLFDNLAHGLTRAGEYYIQGSMFMGLMTEKDFDSFEYKKNKDGVDELVLKQGIDEKEFKDRMISNKNRVSDIQGKYSEKDRRNFMAGEFGKMVGQFKVWVPDWWKERFGEEYITADGQTKKGSYRNFTVDATKDLIEQVKAEGPKAIWNNKEAMTNLKGALSVAVLLSLKLGGDDDDKKRKQGDLLSQMTSNVLFVFDPSGLKFTVTSPIAALGTLGKFADVLKDAVEMDTDKLSKDIIKVIPNNKIITQIPKLINGE